MVQKLLVQSLNKNSMLQYALAEIYEYSPLLLQITLTDRNGGTQIFSLKTILYYLILMVVLVVIIML